MKNDKKNFIGKKFGKEIIKQLYKQKEIISVTIVGSISKNFNLDQIGDLDVVVICKKITNKLIKISKKKIVKIKSKYPSITRDLKINDTFGPVKYDSKKYFTVHLMIYDIDGHKKHVMESPFTCFDWQRSNWFKGKKLSDIFPVQNIYFRDFFESRRGANEYLKDLKNNNISIRKYKIEKNKIYVKKINYKINPKNRGEFVFHIINNLINNYYKFYINKNILISAENFKKLFFKITKKDKFLWNKFITIKKQKKSLKINYPSKSINIAERFLKYFNNFLKTESKNYKEIIFLRHAKTSINDRTFLGQKRNPDILLKKMRFKSKEKYGSIYSSPLKRSISTAKLYGQKKIIINKYLNEINYGDAEGMTFGQYSKKFPEKVRIWKKGKDTKFPAGESTEDVKKRVFKFINNEICTKTRGRKFSRTLVVTHNVFLRCLIGFFLKIDLKDYFKININHLQKFEFLTRGKRIYPNLRRNNMKETLMNLYD